MLIGEYAHTLDVKGRVNFPAKLLTDLGDRFILSKGLDGCLFVYSAEEWGNLERKIKELPLSKSRPLQRYFFAGAAEVEVDKQGRIVIPQKLREHAGLEKDVMIIGASSRAEIWDKERWNLSCEELTAETIESAMEELGF
ncbi:MAG: division/cell wall cluster transcriptional repressor MraZ [Oscillospiraceae bacterium]|nr:division/cell wall cluster transcriptional repressor MraZ [Oscillospiraceae bacterium]MBQ2791916.1 division/cell wall cluster transcriptional repressor MraZ [Oscillospiraceae bacterium]MBQ7082475.1 division/cell wall cluster transcriptional repressor MraZ [Oscillospiraceae bacterium]MBR2636388.1 division/cell wall cluster transcriptional repressor MraZ [Oscillospiraceae bacterium]MBR6608116.1 division/cell wall cluster transcriptional repressor MraZ [Oscillospiraceae bacterium]